MTSHRQSRHPLRAIAQLPSSDRFALALVTALLALRVVYLFTHGVDSDEPQNLHVAYQWWKGDLPYRDQFDNHTPLLHWLFLPFVGLIGESANVVVLARLVLVPLSFGAVWLFYILCRRLYGVSGALWSVALTLALADWSLKSIEFRPDILWMFLWFAALCVLVRPDRGVRPLAFFAAGLLLGASAAASVKTAFLLPALGFGWAGTWLLSKDFRKHHSWPAIIGGAIAAAAGFAIVPGIVALAFASQGALQQMIFCIYAINKDPFLNERSWIFFVGLPLIFAAAVYLVRPGGMRAAYRSAVFLAAASYTLAIIGFGPYESLAKQTFLPAYPLLLATACHVVLSFRPWKAWQICALGGTACVALVAAMIWASPPWQDGTAEQRNLLQAVREHTAPGETVMDLKGETIFRQRPVYLAYVGITSRAMESGNLAAPDPGQLRSAATAIAVERTSSFPEGMRKFLRENYLSTIGSQLRAAGKILKPSWENGQWIERTTVEIPGEYIILKNGKIAETRALPAGQEQTFIFDDRDQRFLFWKAAWDRGLRPKE
jgi:hypothetical protein